MSEGNSHAADVNDVCDVLIVVTSYYFLLPIPIQETLYKSSREQLVPQTSAKYLWLQIQSVIPLPYAMGLLLFPLYYRSVGAS